MTRASDKAHGKVTAWLTQPFRGSDVVVIEKRDADGRLDFTGEQPPMHTATFDSVYCWFFASPENRALDSAGWSDLSAWLDARGWKLRPKTW